MPHRAQGERWFVTGANRGIGLAIVRALLASGDHVFAGCRDLEGAEALQALSEGKASLSRVALDVADDASVRAAFTAVARETSTLDVLINNAGINPRDDLDTFDAARMLHAFDVNAVGPMRVLTAALPLLRASRCPRVIQISSQLGSVTRQAAGFGSLTYNASKAALNVATRQAAFRLADDGVAVIAVHPGWVATDMGGAAAPVDPATSAAGIVALARGLTLAATGRFLIYDGTEHPW